MQINHSSLNADMLSQKFFDDHDIYALLKQMSGIGMSQGMSMNVFGNTGLFNCVLPPIKSQLQSFIRLPYSPKGIHREPPPISIS